VCCDLQLTVYLLLVRLSLLFQRTKDLTIPKFGVLSFSSIYKRRETVVSTMSRPLCILNCRLFFLQISSCSNPITASYHHKFCFHVLEEYTCKQYVYVF
jgi:hypothetical protein